MIAQSGLFGTIYDVGDALGPIAAGVPSVGYARIFQVMAVVALMVTATFYWVRAMQRSVARHGRVRLGVRVSAVEGE